MNRIPKEPIAEEGSQGVVLPEALDFTQLQENTKAPGIIQKHVKDCLKLGLELTDLEREPHAKHIKHLKTVTKIVEKQKLELGVDAVQIAGSPEGIFGIRHQCTLPLPARFVADGSSRLNYTNLVDKFTYIVENLQDIDARNVAWCHVAHTADKLAFFMNERDFCTFDLLSSDGMMSTSRSCIHPARPQNPPKHLFHLMGTYRSPLMWVHRVSPLSESECRVVQFQYSDIGGFVPPKEQTKAVVQFGIDNIPKVFRTLLKAQEKGCSLGPGSDRYLKDPLKPRWRQNPKDMIPGL